MGLIADVTAGNPVTATWGNAVRSASVMQVLASEVASISAVEGQMVYTTDNNRLSIYDGSAWQVLTASARIGATATATAWSVASGAASRTVSFDAETYDSDGFITPASTDVTIPTGLGGLYALSINIQWDTDPGASTWTLLRVNSGGQNYSWRSDTTLFRSGFSTTDFFTGVSAVAPLAAGDVVQAQVTQTSGVAININARLTVYRVGI